MFKRIIYLILFLILSSASFAEVYPFKSDFESILLAQTTPEVSKKEEKILTKGDFILLLTSTDYIKKKIQDLLSWTIGYDVTKIARAKLVPSIRFVKAQPVKVPPDGRTALLITASVDDPSGLLNIEYVRADLSNIGRLPNAILVDNGLWGDKVPNDGIYSLQTSVDESVSKGSKEISVLVSNKKGWQTFAKTTLDVKKEPEIIEAKVIPQKVKADSTETVTFVVTVANPGRLEDIHSVVLDLSSLGKGSVKMVETGKEITKDLGVAIFTYKTVVSKDVEEGQKKILVKAMNVIGGESKGEIELIVTK